MYYNIYGVSRYRMPFLVATVDYTLTGLKISWEM